MKGQILFIFLGTILCNCTGPEYSYNRALESRSIEDFQKVIEKYPNSDFSQLAKVKIEEVIYWSGIDSSHSSSNFQTYLDSFPDGLFNTEANNFLKEINEFKMARETDFIESYLTFQEQYPNSLFRDSIQQRLRILESALIGFQTLKNNKEVIALESYIREFEGTGYAKEILKKVDSITLNQAEEKVFSLDRYKSLPKSIDSIQRVIIKGESKSSVLLAKEAFENILIEQFKNKKYGFSFVIPEVDVGPSDLSTKYAIKKSESNESVEARLVNNLLNRGWTVSGTANSKQKINATYIIYTEFSDDLFPLFFSHYSGDKLYGAKGEYPIFEFDKEHYAANTIWRFYGSNTLISGYEIIGDTSEPLCFILLQGIGAVYLYGKGIVKSDKDEVRLG